MADEIKGHPAWQEILDVLPESLHGIVKPALAKWDEGVQTRFKEIHEEYAAYKELKDNNIDPEAIKQGLGLLQNFQNDPEGTIKQAIEAFDLDFVTKAELDAVNAQVGSDDPDDYDSIEDDPRFKSILDTVNEMKSQLDSQKSKERENQEQEALEAQLKKLEEDNGSFDKLFVTALIANGVDGTQAVKKYHDTINQAVENKLKADGVDTSSGGGGNVETPVVMNGGGDAGSGIPEQPVQFGDMQDKDVKELVAQMLQQGAES